MNDWHFPRATQPAASADPHMAAPEERCSNAPSAVGDWEQMMSSENVTAAWERVRRNGGAAGVDGVTVRDLESTFPGEWRRVANALQEGAWSPHPVRRVAIPKPDGGWRQLGISTVLDRVVHQAVSQVLTPRWEARFSPRSFGFRKGRGAHEALSRLAQDAAVFSSPIAWHLDIRDFFDRVPRARALRAVSRVTTDERLQQVTASILDAGAIVGGRPEATPQGLPQGSPLSPLLANAVLHPLDLWMTEQGLPFIRYADDIVILLADEKSDQGGSRSYLMTGANPAVRGQRFHESRAFVQEKLTRLGLELNERKCELTPLSEACVLGFSLYSHGGRWCRKIASRSWEAFAQECQRRDTWTYAFDGAEREGTKQDYARGWAAYFSLTECPQDQERLRELLRRTVSVPSAMPVRMAYDGRGAATNAPHRNAMPVNPQINDLPPKGPFHHFHHSSWRTWIARLFTRRWISFGLDFGRGFRAVRVRVGPLNLRFRF